MTASAVPAIDFEWRVLKDSATGKEYNIAELDKLKENVTPNFYHILKQHGNTGNCWVSNYCFLPRSMLENGLNPLMAMVSSNLQVFYNTVIKKVSTENGFITGINTIQRSVKQGIKCNGYDKLLNEVLLDWYSPIESASFTKQAIFFTNATVYMDATEWGEVLVS